MLETPHVVVAAAIATKVANPALAIPLAFGSHFVLEMVPHWNPHINAEMKKYGKISEISKKIIAVDVVLSLLSGFYIASLSFPDSTKAITIILSCLVAVTPDLIEAPYYLIGEKIDFLINKWIPFKKSIQSDAPILVGLLTQITIIAAGCYWILD